MTVCAAAFAVGLTLICEAVSWQEMSEIWSFLETDLGLLVMKNTALLMFVLILALYFLTTKISAALTLKRQSSIVSNSNFAPLILQKSLEFPNL